MSLCIGLFGTRNNSWRTSFIDHYKALDIKYFNPIEAEAEKEICHLKEDKIILFPILGESYEEDSLSELGFGIQPLIALKQNGNRNLIFYIETQVQLTNSNLRKVSLQSRNLILEYLQELNDPTIFVVNSLDKMKQVSVELYEVHAKLEKLRLLASEVNFIM
jgi:hypothetical protein